jgi:hypothetical protein
LIFVNLKKNIMMILWQRRNSSSAVLMIMDDGDDYLIYLQCTNMTVWYDDYVRFQ